MDAYLFKGKTYGLIGHIFDVTTANQEL